MAKKKTKTKKKQNVKSKSRTKAAPKKSLAKPAKKSTGGLRAARSSWLDEAAQMPVIDQYARQLGSFIDAMADGLIEETELKSQELRLVKLMKEIEPKLDAGLHEKVTQLLCELTAYDIMQMLHAMQTQRPQTTFRG